LMFTRFSFSASLTTLLSEAMGKKDSGGVRQLIIWFVKNLFVVNGLIVVMIIIVPFLASYFYPGIDRLYFYVQIYMLSIFFSGVFFLVGILFQILRQTGKLSFLEVSKDFLWRLIAIISLLMGLEIFGVVLAQLIVALVFLVISIALYYRIRRDQGNILPTAREIIRDFRSVSFFRHFKFTTSITVDMNLASLYTSLPVFLVGLWSTETQAGLLGLAIHLISVPKSLAGNISKMLSSVLPYKKGHERGEKWIHDFMKVTRTSFPILAGIFLAFGVVAWFLIPVIYGAEFAQARVPLAVLVIANLGIGYTLSLGPVLRTIQRVDLSIITNAISLVLMGAVMYFIIPIYGALGAVIGMFMWKIMNWLLVGYMFRILKKGEYEHHTI